MQSASSPRIATTRRAVRAYIRALNCLYKNKKENNKTRKPPDHGVEADEGKEKGQIPSVTPNGRHHRQM
jgi:hypothetical protein